MSRAEIGLEHERGVEMPHRLAVLSQSEEYQSEIVVRLDIRWILAQRLFKSALCFAGLAGPGQSDTQPEPLKPAVSVKKSITPDYLVCLEDGKKFKSLKRHLATVFDMTPDEYRTKWSLPPDYPMVAPNYAAQRSALAKQSGLGQLRKRSGSAAGQ